MMIRGVLELTTELPGDLLRRLAFEGYRASAEGEVVLVRDRGVAGPVDAALDDAVERIGLDVAGTRFFHGDREELLRLSEAARLVVASSREFRSLLEGRELPFRDPEEGLRALEHGPDAVPGVYSASGASKREKRREQLITAEVP